MASYTWDGDEPARLRPRIPYGLPLPASAKRTCWVCEGGGQVAGESVWDGSHLCGLCRGYGEVRVPSPHGGGTIIV